MQKNDVTNIIVYFEDWVTDKNSFYSDVFELLDVPHQSLGASSLSVTTPERMIDLLSNYDEIAAAVTKAGFKEFSTNNEEGDELHSPHPAS